MAAPVEVGIRLIAAARARRRSLCGRSRICWSFVYAWIVVMNPRSMPARSSSTFASGAMQFVVHDAFEITWCFDAVVLVVVDAEDDRDVGLGRGRRDDHLLRACVDVLLRARRGSVKKPVDSSTTSTPRSPQGRFAGSRSRQHLHLLAAGADDAVAERHLAGERAHRGVVLEEVRHRLRVAEVVDRDDLDVGAELLLRAEEVPSDAAEAVDADPCRHDSPFVSFPIRAAESNRGRGSARPYPSPRSRRAGLPGDASGVSQPCARHGDGPGQGLTRQRPVSGKLDDAREAPLHRRLGRRRLRARGRARAARASGAAGAGAPPPGSAPAAARARARGADRRRASICSCAARLWRTRFAWSALPSRFACGAQLGDDGALLEREHGVARAHRRRAAPRSPPSSSRRRASASARSTTREPHALGVRDRAEEARARPGGASAARGAATAGPRASRRRGTRRGGRRRGSSSCATTCPGGRSSGAPSAVEDARLGEHLADVGRARDMQLEAGRGVERAAGGSVRISESIRSARRSANARRAIGLESEVEVEGDLAAALAGARSRPCGRAPETSARRSQRRAATIARQLGAHVVDERARALTARPPRARAAAASSATPLAP